jgi:uncharacterized protein with HEPN domain
MLDVSRKAVAAISLKSRKSYDQDEILRMALAHFIQVIGETARKVSPEFQAAYQKIPGTRLLVPGIGLSMII